MQEQRTAQMPGFSKHDRFKKELFCVRECRLRPTDQHSQVFIVHYGKSLSPPRSSSPRQDCKTEGLNGKNADRVCSRCKPFPSLTRSQTAFVSYLRCRYCQGAWPRSAHSSRPFHL